LKFLNTAFQNIITFFFIGTFQIRKLESSSIISINIIQDVRRGRIGSNSPQHDAPFHSQRIVMMKSFTKDRWKDMNIFDGLIFLT